MTTDPLLPGQPSSFITEDQAFDPKSPDVIHGTKTAALIALMLPFVCMCSMLHNDLPRWCSMISIVIGPYVIVCFYLRLFGVRALSLPDLFHECSHWVGAVLLNIPVKSLQFNLFPRAPSKRFPCKLGNPNLSIGEPISFRVFLVVALFPIIMQFAAAMLFTATIPAASMMWWMSFSVFLVGSVNDLSWVLMIIERKGTRKLIVDHGNHLSLQ